jgi:hypothetical protein
VALSARIRETKLVSGLFDDGCQVAGICSLPPGDGLEGSLSPENRRSL